MVAPRAQGTASGDLPTGPVRTCVVCRTRRSQRELLRVVARGTTAVVDPRRRLPGRGAYVCPTGPCMEALGGPRLAALRRALRAPDLTGVRPDEGDRTDDPTGRTP
jgi:uncharacterized protein